MRMTLLIQVAAVLPLFFGLSTQSAVAQSPVTTAAPTRDPAAIAAVQNAITALGGAVNIAAISDCTAQGTFQINPSDPTTAGTFVWKTAGSEFNYSTQTNSLNRIFVSGHGTPADLRNAATFQTGPQVLRATLPYHIPGIVLLTEFNSSNYSITYIGPETRNGSTVIHVQTADDSDAIATIVTPQDWYLDASSYLPVSVQYRIPDPIDSMKYTLLTKDFGAFHQISGVLVPSSFVIDIGGGPQAITITSIVFNSGLSSSTFDVPAGGTQQ